MTVTIYHNPRCSKSRQTLALLQQQGCKMQVVEYLQNPPDKKSLQHILKMLGLSARQLMRRQESAYKDNQLDNPDLDEATLIEYMIKHPILMERPIVVNNNHAVIGRPPENVLKII